MYSESFFIAARFPLSEISRILAQLLCSEQVIGGRYEAFETCSRSAPSRRRAYESLEFPFSIYPLKGLCVCERRVSRLYVSASCEIFCDSCAQRMSLRSSRKQMSKTRSKSRAQSCVLVFMGCFRGGYSLSCLLPPLTH